MDKVLVLNSDFTPLNVTTLRRGFILVQKGRAEVLKKGDDIVTTIGNFVRPVIIRLLNFVRFRPHNLSVSRKRIFKRDNYECGYCGWESTSDFFWYHAGKNYCSLHIAGRDTPNE